MKDYSNFYPSYKDKMKHDAALMFQRQLEGFDGHSGTLDGISVRVIIQDHTNPLNEYKEDRKVICEDSISIHRGSIYNENGENYLVITDIDTNGVYKTAKMQKATDFLKWRDSTNTIHSIPAIVTNLTLYSDGLQEGKMMILGDGKRQVVIPNNDETKILYEKQRFIIGRKVYEISHIDEDTQPGVLNIIMVQTEIVADDDWVNKIAYNGEIETIQPDSYTINILNNQSITLGYYGIWQIQYEVRKNGDLVNLPVVFSSTNTSAATVNTSGLCQTKAINSSTNIVVKLRDIPSIYTTVAINVTNQAHNYTVDIDGNDSAYLSEILTYKAIVRDLGVVVPNANVVWELNLNGNPQGIVNMQQTSNNEVKLSINNNGIVGTIYLTAKYANDVTKLDTKAINIQGLSLW